MGEGSAFVVLETLAAAQARGARLYAEIVGSGDASDVARLLTPDPGGRALAHAIDSALRASGETADGVDFVAAHGSGTRLGDASEGHALRAVFGAGGGAAGGGSPAVSSVKPATGHLGAGAGALNLAVAALAVHHGVAPPTLNLASPDPRCGESDWIVGAAREAPFRSALALARGLEGQNVALAVRAV